MATRATRKDGLSGIAERGRRLALRGTILTVALLVVGAPIVAGLATGASTTGATAQPKVDVVFVFDRSESTNEDRYQMAQEIDRLNERVEGANVDARYGLVTYNDEVQLQQGLTSDFDAFERAMAFPEGGSEEHASDAILRATGMDFREDARTVVVVVTDEDDDSTNATRDRALSALSDVDFVAVSPSSPYESSCAVHSPPCDNRTDNELRTMAGETGGEWIDQSQSAGTIVDAVADSVLSGLESGSNDGGSDDAGSTASPSFETTASDVNRTTAEVGDPVAVERTVENVGDAAGTYDAYLSVDGEILAERSVEIPAGEARTVTIVHRFDDPGDYELLVRYEEAGAVTVTEPRAERVGTTVRENGTAVDATVADAWTNDSVRIPTNGTALAPAAVGSITGLVVSVGDANVTPAHDVAFDASVAASETPPNGTEALPDHVADARYLTVSTDLGAALAGVQFEYEPGADGTTLFRYDDANATWVGLETEAANGSNGTVRTGLDDGGVYAIGVRQAATAVTAVELGGDELTVGESTIVVVTVENEGTAAGTHEVTFRVGDAVVDSENVTVAASDTETVSFVYTPASSGTVTVDVGGNVTAELSVAAAPTDSATPTATATDDETDTAEPTATTAESRDGQQSPLPMPGFGIGLALVALLGALLFARRRV